MDNKTKELLESFLEDFESVFHYDWEFSKMILGSDDLHHYISDSGTFLDPQVGDESNNWGNRGGLLASYRKLCAHLNRSLDHTEDDYLITMDQVRIELAKEISVEKFHKIVSEFTELLPAGKLYLKGCCPFHEEKTPSFFLRKDKSTYMCFGCEEAGNPISFVMNKMNLSFPEAVKFLTKDEEPIF